MAQRAKKKYGIDDIISVFGLALALFAVLILLSPMTRLRGLAMAMDAFLGLIGFYGIGLGLLLLGVHMLLHRVWKPFPLRIYIGVFIALPSLAFLLSGLAYPHLGDLGAGATYYDYIELAYNGDGKGLFSDLRIGGGWLGSLLANPLGENVGNWLIILISSLLLAASLVVFFFPLIKSFVRFARARILVAKAERNRRKEEDALAFLGPERYEKEQEADEEEEAPRQIPMKPAHVEREVAPSFGFAMAGGTSLPTRRDYQSRQGNAPQSPTYVETIPTVTPPRTGFSNMPLKHSGLQEAFFEYDGFTNEPEKPAAPIATPPMSLPATPPPSYVEPRPAPAVVPPVIVTAPAAPEVEPEPEEEMLPAFAPSFIEEPNPVIEEGPVEGAPSSSFLDDVPFAPAYEEEIPEENEDMAAQNDEAKPQAFTPTPVTPKNPEDEIPNAEPLPPYQFPSIDLLTVRVSEQNLEEMEQECAEKTEIINRTFADLGVGAQVVGHTIGPSVTRFAIQPRSDVSVSSLGRYVKDIEVRLGGIPTRFAERVAGMTTCALEVANRVSRTVSFRELYEALPPRQEGVATLRVPFGLDISGNVKEADLAEFPHMLVAGTTGSGKSIFAHGLLMSLIMRNRPEDLKLVLVDPKRVEMTKYKDLPHLLCPIIKESNEAKNALKKLCEEMERRFKIFETAGVQNLREFNTDYCVYAGKKKMPFIVLFIDEFSDLVMADKNVSEYILRLGQKARAAGIHMIIATQRPDVKVITGTIKANIPVKVALTVASTVDSMTILGQGGAEDLNGKGDMLIDCVQIAKKEFVRAQGCFCDSRELRAVTDFIRSQQGTSYDPNFLNLQDEEEPEATPGMGSIPGMGETGPSPQDLRNANNEEKYQLIKSAIMTREFTSISQIQRDFGVGFPRAGKIFSRLQNEGIVALASDSPTSSKGCRVLVHEAPSETGGE